MSLFKGWENLKNLAENISQKSGKVNEFMNAINSFGSLHKDKAARNNLISYLSKLHKSQLKKANDMATNNKKSSKTNKSSSTNVSKVNSSFEDQSFYDVINSPGLQQIVKEVMNKKRRSRRKK